MNRQNLLAIACLLILVTGCHSIGDGSCFSKLKRSKHREMDVPCQCAHCYQPLYPGDTWALKHSKRHSKHHKKHSHDSHQFTFASHVTCDCADCAGDPGCVAPMTVAWTGGCGDCGTFDHGCNMPGMMMAAPDCGMCGGSGMIAAPYPGIAPSTCACSAPTVNAYSAGNAYPVMVSGQSYMFSEASCGMPGGPSCMAPAAPSCLAPASPSCESPSFQFMPTPDCATQQMAPGSYDQMNVPSAVPPAYDSSLEAIPTPPAERPMEQQFHAPKVDPPAEQGTPADPAAGEPAIQQTGWNNLDIPRLPMPATPPRTPQPGQRLMIRQIAPVHPQP